LEEYKPIADCDGRSIDDAWRNQPYRFQCWLLEWFWHGELSNFQ